jgi:hypothetical protein
MEHTRLNEHLERHFKGGVYYSCVLNEEATFEQITKQMEAFHII